MEAHTDIWQFSAHRKADYNQTYESIKTALGESAFSKIHAEGKAMTLDQGVAFALEIIE